MGCEKMQGIFSQLFDLAIKLHVDLLYVAKISLIHMLANMIWRAGGGAIMKKVQEQIQAHMRKMCFDIGSKHCGSQELDKAGQYIASVLQKEGYEVIKEEYPIRGWEYHSFSLHNVTRGYEVPAASACLFSNAVDIYDTPLWINWYDIANLEALPVQGRLCFVTSWAGKDFQEACMYDGIAEKLDCLGAAAAIFLSPHSNCAPSTKIERSPFLKQMGAVAIAEQGAIYMANHKNDLYHLKIDARCFDTTTYNVIGRIGHGHKKGVVGAHYDTAPLIAAAQDNVGGVVITLEVASLMKEKLQKLEDEWTIDFVAFSAEEYIPYLFPDYERKTLPPGSGDYVQRHRDENIKWFLNIDTEALHFGYPEVHIDMIDKLPELSFRYPYEVKKAGLAGDNKSFNAVGIPSVWIRPKLLFSEVHSVLDDFAHTDFARMEEVTMEYAELLQQLVEKTC